MPTDDLLPDVPSLPSSRPFLSLPDVIRERIYYFVLLVEVDPTAPWITPLPPTRQIPKHLPGLSPEPTRDLDHVSKRVRKKRRRRIRAWEQAKEETTLQAQLSAPPSCLAILQTCSTILLEAFHLWYKHNTLNFRRSADVYTFLVSIGRARANEIRSIRLDLRGHEWDDGKATYTLMRLVRLENLTFVYNNYSPMYNKNDNISYIEYPKIISRLRGLREVTFENPPDEANIWGGLTFGMTEGVRNRMQELRQKMMQESSKKPRVAPPMVDLFSRLKLKDQSRKDAARWGWDEHLSYAPEVGGDDESHAGNGADSPHGVTTARRKS